jgi:DNA-binding transcriptional MerR regulator
MSFTIRELESLSGVRAHTIRIWEQRYNFLKPSRTLTNIRTYNNEELKTLLTVALLNKYGYKISRIDRMQPDQRAEAALQLPQNEAYYENLVNDMIGYMIDLDHIAFEQLLNTHIQLQGIENTITQLIFNFLEKVGILWQTNRIVPVQEHVVSNIIRQKIVSAIEGLPFVHKPSPLFLLLLPEDEHHEMGLLFVYYLLRKKGIPVIYLGANVPAKDVGYLLEVKKPDHLYLHLTSFPRQHNFQKYLSTMAEYAKDSQLIFSGWATQLYRKPLPPNVHFLKSFHEVISYISALQS